MFITQATKLRFKNIQSKKLMLFKCFEYKEIWAKEIGQEIGQEIWKSLLTFALDK